MKKFLSLVLALVMAMSLVTISAGATEYKDLTDKDEIQYEEAVAVLNRIGVITGYEDGSFKPEGELTRGAAAKIIVSLLIGPEAANNLPNNAAPYPDVPAGSTFAGVISYCKNKNIISGYGDGTFKPTGTLTGFAFAKMLLGAVGYDAKLEGFEGAGWTMNVASIGHSASLFDRLQFDGSKTVNREEACQLALNALKATVVQYSQGINVNVTGADTNVVVTGGQTRSFKTSNQEFARNIRTKAIDLVDDDYFTVEFAEEHFVDLRLEHDKWNPTPDDFGRPSAEWSYKKVTIGTYPLAPDFSYTTQAAHIEATDSAKVRALGLKGYELENDRGVKDATLWLNGVSYGSALETVGQIANYTDNGTLVEIYVDNNDADHITDVVVIRTQLMEVKRVGSDYVSLDQISQDNEESVATAAGIQGFNHAALNEKTIKNVNVDEEGYDVLSALKAGDAVAIVPVSTDGGRTWEVARAYVPETVSGRLSKVTTYGAIGSEPNAVDITVGGTTYKIATWNKDMHDLTADVIKVTTKDVTLILDEYGNALRAKDVGATNDYMVVGNWSQTLQNGRIVWLAEGWDGSGNAVSLNVGTSAPTTTVAPGDLVYYTNEGTTGVAEWVLTEGPVRKDGKTYGVYDVDNSGGYEIKASNVRVSFVDAGRDFADDSAYFARDVKFIYVDQENNGTDVDTIEIFTGAQAVSNTDLGLSFLNPDSDPNPAQVYMNKDGYIEAVVIKTASNSARTGNLIYIMDYDASHSYNSDNGTKYYGYLVAMMGPDGTIEEKTICSTRNLKRGDFATYTKATDESAPLPDEFYTLRFYNSQQKTTSVITADVDRILSSGFNAQKDSKDLMLLKNIKDMDGVTLTSANCDIMGSSNILNAGGSEANLVRVLKSANWVDVTAQGWDIDSLDELDDYADISLALVFNDKVDSDGFRSVSTVVVLRATSKANSVETPETPTTTVPTIPGMSESDANKANDVAQGAPINKGDAIVLDATISNAAAYDRVSYQWQVLRRDPVSGDPVLDSNGNQIWDTVAGANEATFTVPTTGDAAGAKNTYRCAVTVRDNSKDDVKVTTTTTAPATFDVAEQSKEEEETAAKTAEITLNFEAAEFIVEYDGSVKNPDDVLKVTPGATVTLTVTPRVDQATGVISYASANLTDLNVTEPTFTKGTATTLKFTAATAVKNATVTLSYRDLVAELLAGVTVTKGTLHDTANEQSVVDWTPVPDDVLMAYTVSKDVADGKLNIVIGGDLYAHYNAQSPQAKAYWTGFGITAPTGWTVTKHSFNGNAEADWNGTDFWYIGRATDSANAKTLPITVTFTNATLGKTITLNGTWSVEGCPLHETYTAPVVDPGA